MEIVMSKFSLTRIRMVLLSTLAATIAAALFTTPAFGAQRGGANQGQRGGGNQANANAPKPGPIRRMPDGQPDLTGYYSANSGGANYGLEKHDRDLFTP